MKNPDGPSTSNVGDPWLVPAISVGSAGLALLAEELLRAAQVQDYLPSSQPHVLAGVVAFVPSWMITAACFRQKNTYNAAIYEKNPGCVVPAWILFLSVILTMVGFVLGGPAYLILGVAITAGRGEHWAYAAGILGAGLASLVVSVSALSRGLWIWDMKRHVDQLATSTVRGAAHGLVELRGIARPLTAGPGDELIFGQTHGDSTKACPFMLEDATGRIRIEPPAMDASGDPRIALKPHPFFGLPMLRSGDEVLVIGALTADPERPDLAVIRPWRPSRLPFGTRLLSRPDVFLLVCGDEPRAKRRLFRSRTGWFLLGAALTLGSLVLAAVGASSLAWPRWVATFRAFAR